MSLDTEAIVTEPEAETTQEPIEGETPETEPEEGTPAETESDEVIVTFEGEVQPKEEETKTAPPWVKELRKSHKDQLREIKRLEAELEKAKPQPEPVSVVGEKPTLSGCDFDGEVFERELLTWNDRKKQVEAEEERKRKKQTEHEQAWQERLSTFAKLKAELKVNDYDETEAEVTQALNQTQQGIVVQYTKNPASFIYALGKNEARLKEVAGITDPITFAFAVRDLEAKVSVTKKTPPPPETVPVRSGSVGGGMDNSLDRLRAEAEKTGDYTKVHQYKAQQKAKTKG